MKVKPNISLCVSKKRRYRWLFEMEAIDGGWIAHLSGPWWNQPTASRIGRMEWGELRSFRVRDLDGASDAAAARWAKDELHGSPTCYNYP